MSQQLPKLSTIRLLFEIAARPSDDNYALALCESSGYPTGTVVPLLKRLAERDGLLTRNSLPRPGSKPRIVHALTRSGWSYVRELSGLVTAKFDLLSRVDATASDTTLKWNTSGVWVMAAVVDRGSTYGYDESMRPLTHQAAYVELERLRDLELLTRTAKGTRSLTPGERLPRPDDAERYEMTALGASSVVALCETWIPLLARVNHAPQLR